MKPRPRHTNPHRGQDRSPGPKTERGQETESLPSEDPFAVLGIAPTLDMAQVKRAYFAALARHPPHRDGEGFRRLRAAYEALMAPEGLAAAYAASPPDLLAELARYRARLDEALTKAATRPSAAEDNATRAARLIEQISRMSWTQTIAALSTRSG
ncbi:MAG TPA: J domain-containing protein [Polyangia bacterium]|nr:J domain-containing protein [Polyangia bacterium]